MSIITTQIDHHIAMSDNMPQEQPEGITRRQILEVTGGAAAVGLAGSGAAVAHSGNEELENIPLIDVHTHLVPIRAFDRAPFRVDDAVNWMDENGVDKMVVLPLESPTSWSFPIPSWWVLRETQKYSDRFIPFCTVAPQLVDQFGEETIAERIEAYVNMGAQGFGELKAPIPFNDPRAQSVYEACAEFDLPIVFHIDGVNMTDEVGLPRTEEMLQSYPDVDFIGHGPGWWASIGADLDEVGTVYPEGPIQEAGAVPRLLSEYDNIYADISAGSGWGALTRDPEFTQSFLERHHEQIMFGTDKLSTDQTVDQFALFNEFELDLNQWKNIRYQNLRSVLS